MYELGRVRHANIAWCQALLTCRDVSQSGREWVAAYRSGQIRSGSHMLRLAYRENTQDAGLNNIVCDV